MAKQNTSHIDDPSALGRRLRISRVERGLTQSALVFDGCTIGHISRIEAGLRTPSLQVVHKLAAMLGIDEHWLATGSPRPPEPVEETMLRAARVAIHLGELDEAREAIAWLDGRDDLSPALQARVEAARGKLWFAEDRTRDAINALREAFTIDPDLVDPEAAETLGRAYARLERLQDAIELFRERLARAIAAGDPAERLRFGVLLANAQVDADQVTAAAETLARIGEDVADGDPQALARLYWTRSRLHTQAGDAEKAVELARRTLSLLEAGDCQVQRARAHQLLAHAELAAGRPSEALSLVSAGRQLLGVVASSHDRMLIALEEARALVMLGRTEEAAAIAMEAVGLLPEDSSRIDIGRGYTELASAFAHAGDRERAREIFELAIELLEGGPRRYREDAQRRYAELVDRTSAGASSPR
ncbi:MAG: helix-turn-helix domain-containing protein [Actinobacteria bacterium]|nr:helix-turn-helix domain-containing protein [Actinomycetota bacterium]